MGPARRAIDIYRGDTYTHTVEVPSTTGRTYAAQIRDTSDALVATFAVEVVDATTVVLSLSSTITAALVPQVAAWDLESTDGDGRVLTLLRGPARIVKDETR